MDLRRLILTLMIFGYSLYSSAQLYTFKNFNHRDGLTMASISSLVQSKDGYLWIGTDGAPLMRYDGEKFEEILEKGDDDDHHIENLIIDGDSILFASKYKGFYYYSIKKKKYTNLGIKSNLVGEAVAVFKDANYHYLIGQKAIYSLQDKIRKKLKAFKNLELYHYFKCKDGIVIFTNHGNYVLKDGAVKSLSDLFKLSKSNIDEFRFGYYSANKYTLFNAKAGKWIEILVDNKGMSTEKMTLNSEKLLAEDEIIISFNCQEKGRNAIALTNKGSLFHVRNNSLYKIAHNYSEPLIGTYKIMCDLNGDYWVCSKNKGLYKVSLEPFTKIQLHPIYEKEDIGMPYRTMYNDIFISLFSGKTYVGNFDDHDFTEFPFSIKSVTQVEGDYFLATNIGIKKYVQGVKPTFEDLYFNNENVTFILEEKEYLWAGVAGKGIIRITIKTGEKKEYRLKQKLPQYFYTGQVTANGSVIYFGTNDGIFKYDMKTDVFTEMEDVSLLGSYSGCSTKDVYGTIWLTLDKGIVGITTDKKTIILKGSKHFKTNLYYTLSSDRLGNLIVGTNKGLTVLQVNRLGEVVGHSHYDANSGFGGYETHMRSQYQDDNNIYVGTVEGLFLINTDILNYARTPLAPTIIELTKHNGEENNSFNFKFHVNNQKIGSIQYMYRLLGESEDWIFLDEQSELQLYNLKNGNYTLEVKASHDGAIYSDVSSYSFSVKLPVWKTNWFIILIVVFVIGVNILLINYSRAFERNSLLKTKDSEVHLIMTPNIILLGIVAAGGSYILGPLLNPELDLHIGSVLIMEFCLLILYFLAKSVIGTSNEYQLSRFLMISVGVVMIHSYFELYVSGIHPFHIIAIILATMVTPFFLHQIKSMVIFSSLILLATMIIVVLVDNEVYPKSYFVIANITLIALLVFLSYLRSDSLDKLLFISSIINKGSIPAIAFTNEGKIVYASENISKFMATTHNEILNKDVSILNNYVPFEGRFREVNVVKEFKDGEKYLVPMANEKSQIRWIEWEYKDFSNDVKVMLGQDVSEKMELENTYELLVQNAEDFIYRCNIHGDFIFLNNICYEKLGYTKQDLLNKDSISIVPDKYSEEVRKYYADQFEQKGNTSYKEFPIQKKNGEIIWIGQYVTTLYTAGSNTQITGFIALARDITEIRQQQQLIKDQRDDITSSISYAQRIQINLLPHERNFNSLFKEYFIIYKPKDIVSGDFYWMEKIGNKTILALADCTGHGVPGSFMTLLGINLLNSIVLEGRISDPGDILNEIDKRLVDVLPRGTGDMAINDGMEITICVIDDKTNELAYACAGSRFLIYEDNAFTMLKGDNKHIGDESTENFSSYSTHYTPFSAENQLYLFSDGFQDQFGGTNDKKFSFRRILELLESKVDLPLVKQRIDIEHEFDDWTGSENQTDDVTIISIKRNVI